MLKINAVLTRIKYRKIVYFKNISAYYIVEEWQKSYFLCSNSMLSGPGVGLEPLFHRICQFSCGLNCFVLTVPPDTTSPTFCFLYLSKFRLYFYTKIPIARRIFPFSLSLVNFILHSMQ